MVNALLVPYLLSAIRMLESGFAATEDIDNDMARGCAHPMGPLRLADLIGLDTTKAVAESLHEEFKEPLYAAPPLLLRMVDAALYGKKSGCGFFGNEAADPDTDSLEFGPVANGVDLLDSAITQLATPDVPRSLKYTVLHLQAAIEILVKIRLQREGTQHVFEDPYSVDEYNSSRAISAVSRSSPL